MNEIFIKAPRWKDRTVLVAKFRVQDQNLITFTDKKKDGQPVCKPGIISGDEIRQCKLDTNGSLACYAVPLSMLKGVERSIEND